MYFKRFIDYNVFLFFKFVLIFANGVDPDEMKHDAAFNLRLHCLLKYQYIG